jgi:hypothetical protein
MIVQNANKGASQKASRRRPDVNKLTNSNKYIVTALFFVALYYSSYRYPFQIGDGILSPTYEATPLWLQVLKFALIAILNVFGMAFLRKDMKFSLLELMIMLFSVSAVLYSSAFASLDFGIGSRLFEIGFIPFSAIILSNPANFSMQAFTFSKMIRFYFWFNIFVYVIQFYLFWFFDRLPNLAFGGATTRFGGIWDDPNSALAPFALYVPYWLITNKIGWKSVAILLLTVISIILAQSITSLAAIFLTVPILILFFRRQWTESTQYKVLFVSIFVIFFASIAFLIIYLSGSFDYQNIIRSLEGTLGSKSESASLRANSYSLVYEVSLLTIFGFNPLLATGENQFINLFVNFGIFILALFIAIHLQILTYLYRWTRIARSRENYALAVSCSCYFMWYFISMINIPKAEVFPVNLLAAIVAGLAIAATKGNAYGRSAPRSTLDRSTSYDPLVRKTRA